MDTLKLPFEPRFITLTLAIAATLLFLFLFVVFPAWDGLIVIPLIIAAGLSLLGIRDLVQTRHAVLRNFPILAHLRFILEEIRPEMRQYFFEDKERYAICPRCPRRRLPARQAGSRQAPLRYTVRCL